MAMSIVLDEGMRTSHNFIMLKFCHGGFVCGEIMQDRGGGTRKGKEVEADKDVACSRES